MSETEEIEKTVKDTTSKLMEYCDSVRIFVTFSEPGTDITKSYESGKGNFYAQLGQILEWVSLQDQFQRNYAIKKDKEV